MDYETGIKMDMVIEGVRDIATNQHIIMLLFKEADPVKYKKVLDGLSKEAEKKKE